MTAMITKHLTFIHRIRMGLCTMVCAGLCAGAFAGGTVAWGKDLPTESGEIFAMDTYMTVSAIGENAKEAVDASLEEIRRLDALWSVGEEDSVVSALNRHERVELDEDTSALLEKAEAISSDTGGAFDITIYPLMEEWGFTTGQFRVPDPQELEELLEHVDSGRLGYDGQSSFTLPEDLQIDLGGIAKGYTSGRIMEIFEEFGIKAGLVSLGGNVETYRTKQDGSLWRIGIQNPDQSIPALAETDVIGIVQAADQAVITSGGYERFFEEGGITYHHILDPETGMPADNGLISVTIVSPDGCLADGLSTALFVMGREKALSYWEAHRDDFDAILVEVDGSITITAGLENRFTSDLPFEVASQGE